MIIFSLCSCSSGEHDEDKNQINIIKNADEDNITKNIKEDNEFKNEKVFSFKDVKNKYISNKLNFNFETFPGVSLDFLVKYNNGFDVVELSANYIKVDAKKGELLIDLSGINMHENVDTDISRSVTVYTKYTLSDGVSSESKPLSMYYHFSKKENIYYVYSEKTKDDIFNGGDIYNKYNKFDKTMVPEEFKDVKLLPVIPVIIEE